VLVSEILDLIDSFAPFSLAMENDNSGFQAGSLDQEVTRVAMSLDPTLEVLKEASKLGTDLLLTHHPLIYRPFTRMEAGTPEGDALFYANQKRISIICAHTNWDAAGVPEALGNLFELRRIGFLEPKSPAMMKLVFFSPKEYTERILNAIFGTGAGVMGSYSRCFYMGEGTGSFLPSIAAKPYVGKRGEITKVSEERVELVLKANLINKVTEVLLAYHPYETPAYEFHRMESPGSFGYGFVGEWDPPREPLEFVGMKLKVLGLSHTKNIPEKVKRVALMPGSGGSFVRQAKKAGAELFITGEISHHDVLLAEHLNMGVIAAGHYETENPSLSLLKQKLERLALGVNFSLIPAQSPMTIRDIPPVGPPPRKAPGRPGRPKKVDQQALAQEGEFK
jgi:dinuclear metal center YbgI/SA1388 family protein